MENISIADEESGCLISKICRMFLYYSIMNSTYISHLKWGLVTMICENLHLSVEQVMAELDISRATVFREYAKIKEVTGATYDKTTSTWTL